jgi:predicted N-acyltransferase
MTRATRSEAAAEVRVEPSIASIAAADWNACANPDPAAYNPFLDHAFLSALEAAGTVGGRSGWTPQHLVLTGSGGAIDGVAPAYVKTHSQGEYVFDHGWADAYHRAGGRYYPKLQIAVPFTPVPGRRFLARPGDGAEEREQLLGAAAIELTKRLGLSSVHATFVTEGEWQRQAAALGYLKRTDQQFHWMNDGYATFHDFLAALASRKRKTVRKERQSAIPSGCTIRLVTGSDIRERDWDAFFAFYMDTGSRKWGRPYLNRAFFSHLGAAMAHRCLLILVERQGRAIAGALNMIGGDCLYGRYWGAIEHHQNMHFEVCYYQAIEYAIAHKLARVEAGAQGEHKLARGYMPAPTYSLHWIADPSLRRAVARYLEEERTHVAEHREMLAEFGPFRKIVEETD